MAAAGAAAVGAPAGGRAHACYVHTTWPGQQGITTMCTVDGSVPLLLLSAGYYAEGDVEGFRAQIVNVSTIQGKPMYAATVAGCSSLNCNADNCTVLVVEAAAWHACSSRRGWQPPFKWGLGFGSRPRGGSEHAAILHHTRSTRL